ncbi:MAG: MBL fold metallo-hydrolase [Gemmatimonadota bacterium]|nr:MBL fold metallo-hydrolase [Gemmatimonadota bacterium]MDE2985482.1 MBL fold metallo-hydrolase [Gemmatimonadota bacterium]
MRIPRLSPLATIFILAACQAGETPAEDPTPPPGSDYEGPAFEFEEVVPGVYHARGTGSLAVGSHGAVIVNEEDVLLVESHISPAAAYAVVDEIEALTDKPVRYVVNTHYHFDHAHGNQIYPPDVHVIGHEVTREMLVGGGSMGRSYQTYLGGLPAQIAALEERIEGIEDEEERAGAEGTLAYMKNFKAGLDATVPTGPNTTLSERLTLFRGDREIRLLFFGRGHTGGDVVVYLPAERVIVTGDLLVPSLPYMGDGYLEEWVRTLEHLKGLEFDWVLPGHGNPFQDRERIGYLQDYLRDLHAQAVALHAVGLSYEEAATRIDMTAHAERYPVVEGSGVPAVAVQRIFELLEGGR